MVRIALFIPMMWLLVTIVFFLLRVLPGANPVKVMNPKLSNEKVDEISEQMGLNKPIEEQYVDFMGAVIPQIDFKLKLEQIFKFRLPFDLRITFDLGQSYESGSEIATELQLAFGPTLMLSIGAILIGVPFGVYAGAYAAIHREKAQDHILRLFTLAIYSIPIFLLGILMQLTFGTNVGTFSLLPPLGIMEAGGTGDFEHITEIWIIDTMIAGRFDLTIDIILHLIMPCTALGLLIGSSISRQVRINMIHQLEQGYVHFAYARGVSDNKVKYNYALKNATTPVVGFIGLQFALLLAGAILTETTFNIPGLGLYFFQAISNKDYPAVQGALILFIVIVSIVSLISDILYAILDPRIKY